MINPSVDFSASEETRLVGNGDADLIISLPLELFLQILEYLDLADIFRCQRVSKRWRALFSSETVITWAWRRTLGFLGLDSKDVVADNAMAYFQWEHGLESVQPVKKKFMLWSAPITDIPTILYHSRRLCYEIRKIRGVEILDLETGERSRWTDEEAASSLSRFYLSDRYLVLMWVTGLATVWDLCTSQKIAREFDVSYGAACTISIEKDKVLLFCPCRFSNSSLQIHIWDLRANQVHIISSSRNLWLWHMDANENVLVTFEINWEKYRPEVRQTKWTLRGQRLNRKHFHLSLPDGIRFDPLPNSQRTFGDKTVTRLCSITNLEFTMLDLMYDHAIDELSLRWVDYTLPYTSDRGNLCEQITPYMTFQWNDPPNRLHFSNTANGRRIMLPYEMDIVETQTRRLLHEYRRQGTEPPMLLIGDREVICVANYDGIQLWFFNPNFVPDFPDAMPFCAME